MERYDPLTPPDAAKWLSMDEQERLGLVRDYHDRAAIKLANARLHAVFHVIVENQVALRDAFPAERALHRLMAEGLDRHEAVHAIGSVVNNFMHDVLNSASDGEPSSTYLAALERLTAEDWLRSADEAQILDDLNFNERLPVEAIRAADADRVSVVPVFLKAIEQCLKGEGATLRKDALFFIFHLLGQWREKSAYRPLAKLLHLPADEIHSILGDAVTETTHRVMAAVFDDDPGPLYSVILDPTADEYVRSRMCEALAMVTLRGELPRAETERFLRACYSEIKPQEECFVWNGWQSAIAMLRLVDLKPLVKQAFGRGFISAECLSYQDFENDLQHVIDRARPPSWLPDEYSLFGDTIEELSDWHFSNEDCEEQSARDTNRWETPPPAVPAVNPFRHVGRNDPCPCGSGKKYKKCCLSDAA